MKTYLLARTCHELVLRGFHVALIHDTEVSIQPLTTKGVEALGSMLSTDAQLRTAIPLRASPQVVASLLVEDQSPILDIFSAQARTIHEVPDRVRQATINIHIATPRNYCYCLIYHAFCCAALCTGDRLR